MNTVESEFYTDSKLYVPLFKQIFLLSAADIEMILPKYVQFNGLRLSNA